MHIYRGFTPAQQWSTQARVPRRKSTGKKPPQRIPALQPLGNRLKGLRGKRKQGSVAEGAGITSKYLGRIEGAYVNPTAKVLMGLAKSLGVTVGDLFDVPTPPTTGYRLLSPADLDELSTGLKTLTATIERIVRGEPPQSPPSQASPPARPTAANRN